jgi:hypothetical protein
MTNLDLSQAAWRTSSHSGTTGGNCIEVAFAADAVAVRDSMNPAGPVLAFDAGTWASFLGNLRADEPAQR